MIDQGVIYYNGNARDKSCPEYEEGNELETTLVRFYRVLNGKRVGILAPETAFGLVR